MKRNGFTIIELLATIIIVGVISTIAVFSYNRVIDNSRGKAFKNNEKALRTAADNLLTKCATAIHRQPYCEDVPDMGETVRIPLDKLIEGQFMKEIVDPYNGGSFCDGFVDVTNTNGGATNLEFKTCLECHGKISDYCKELNSKDNNGEVDNNDETNK